MENLQGLPVANSPGFSVPDPNLRDPVHWAVLAGHRAAALELSQLMPSHTPAEDPWIVTYVVIMFGWCHWTHSITFIHSLMMTWQTWWHHTTYQSHHMLKSSMLLANDKPYYSNTAINTSKSTTTTTTSNNNNNSTSYTTSQQHSTLPGPLGSSFIPSCSFQWSYRIDGLVTRYKIPNWWALWCFADAFAFGSSRRS